MRAFTLLLVVRSFLVVVFSYTNVTAIYETGEIMLVLVVL